MIRQHGRSGLPADLKAPLAREHEGSAVQAERVADQDTRVEIGSVEPAVTKALRDFTAYRVDGEGHVPHSCAPA